MNTPDTECGCTRTKYCEKHFNESVHKSHPTPDTEWEKECYFDLIEAITDVWHKQCGERAAFPLTDMREAIQPIIQKALTSRDTYWKERVEEIIKMADALEVECGKDGDKGTKQWMAFKGFRNTIRDRFLTNEDNLK